MLYPVSPINWQVLRAVLRAELAGGPPPLGRDLRVSPNRLTKNGTFLDGLVRDGLLLTSGKPVPPADGVDVPAPFRVRYKLTDLGRHAAEYGEYDRPYTPGVVPVKGTAAEVLEGIAARRTRAAGKGAKRTK